MDMTGLEKIIIQIEQDAVEASAQILEKADLQCAEILADAQAECDAIDRAAEIDAANIHQDILSRSESSNQMQRKNRLLAIKQEMISETINKAKQKLLSMSSVDYFVMLGKQAEKYAQCGDGVMYLSANDLSRIPAYFPAKLSQIAAAKGGTLVISERSAEISGGFILAYGGIEENCSFEALFEAEKERLQDIVRAQLFS